MRTFVIRVYELHVLDMLTPMISCRILPSGPKINRGNHIQTIWNEHSYSSYILKEARMRIMVQAAI